jgi:hypothetical protein
MSFLRSAFARRCYLEMKNVDMNGVQFEVLFLADDLSTSSIKTSRALSSNLASLRTHCRNQSPRIRVKETSGQRYLLFSDETWLC